MKKIDVNAEELVKLFDALDSPKLKTICALAFFISFRPSELCNLKIEHMDLDNKFV